MHMYCTVYSVLSTVLVLVLYTLKESVQYKYEYSSEYTAVYSTKCIIIFCSAQFYLGGLSPPSPNDAPPLLV